MTGPESWPEYTETDPHELRTIAREAPESFQELLMLLRDRSPERLTYSEIDQALGWPDRRAHSVFGGSRSKRGTESRRPFHRCHPRDSQRGAWELWLDEDQAAAL